MAVLLRSIYAFARLCAAAAAAIEPTAPCSMGPRRFRALRLAATDHSPESVRLGLSTVDNAMAPCVQHRAPTCADLPLPFSHCAPLPSWDADPLPRAKHTTSPRTSSPRRSE